MFNQKYSNKRVFCLKYCFFFFNVVVIPIEVMPPDYSIVLKSKYVSFTLHYSIKRSSAIQHCAGCTELALLVLC